MFLLGQSSKGGLRTRVGSYIPLAAESGEESSDGPEKRRGRLSRRVEKRRWWPQFIEDVEVARLRPAPAVLIRRAMVGSLFAAALVVFFTGSIPFGLVALFPGRFVLRAAVRRAARRQRVRFADQLPSHLQDASGAIRAGRSFVGALAAVAEKADQPMKKELDRAVADEQLGLPLEDTLQAIARRMRSDDMEQVVLIAALNRRSGSNVAEALDRVAEGARERADMTREMKALTAQAQISSRVLTGLPVVFLGAMALVSPSYAHPMLHTIGGQIALGVCAVLVVLGYKVMARITGAEA
jgi:tight adherence protein B